MRASPIIRAFRPLVGSRVLVRQLSAARPEVVIKNSDVPFKDNSGKDAQFYIDTIRLKHHNPAKTIGIADLNNLWQTCNLPEHGEYIYEALGFYQSHGLDFSEELASHFVRAAIRTGTFKHSIEQFTLYENRIGSWLTPETLHLFVKHMPAEETMNLISSLGVLVKKGMHPKVETWTTLFENLVALTEKNVVPFQTARSGRRRLFRIGADVFSPSVLSQLSEKYNVTVRPASEGTA